MQHAITIKPIKNWQFAMDLHQNGMCHNNFPSKPITSELYEHMLSTDTLKV